jgi:hypothetical protein
LSKEESEKEKDRGGVVERLLSVVFQQAFGGIAKGAERFVKRALRWVALVMAGVVVAVLGVGFVAVGAVKGLALSLPSWEAWLIVGLFLLLLGIVLALLTLATSRK